MNQNTDSKTAVAAQAEPKLGYLQTLFSIIASVAGVQTWSHFERDVKRGSPVRYVVMLGVLMVGYVMLHVLIVHLLLRNTGLE